MIEVVKPRPGLYLFGGSWAKYDEKPIDGAFEALITITQTMAADDPAKTFLYKHNPHLWYEEGMNHRVEDGQIKRELENQLVWAVEVSDLEEFVDKYGTTVIDKDQGFLALHLCESWY